jgi:hypothetical protein
MESEAENLKRIAAGHEFPCNWLGSLECVESLAHQVMPATIPRRDLSEIADQKYGKADDDGRESEKKHVSNIMPRHALPFGDIRYHRWWLFWRGFEMVARF